MFSAFLFVLIKNKHFFFFFQKEAGNDLHRNESISCIFAASRKEKNSKIQKYFQSC